MPSPPGPTSRILGLDLALRFRNHPLEFATELGRYGDLVAFRMGTLRVYLANHPDLIRQVLVAKHKHFRKLPAHLDIFRQVDGEGLVVSEGDFWLRQRRLVQPAFQVSRLAGYGRTMVERAERPAARWQPGQQLDAADAMTGLTLEIIGKTMFDVEVLDDAARLRDAVRVLSEVFTREFSQPFRLPNWLPLPSTRRKRAAIAVLDDLIWTAIRERRASGRDHGDLLSMLLLAEDEQGGARMSDRQVRDEAMTLFNAGHDTTASALAWIWYVLDGEPEAERRLVEELQGVLGDRPATYDDLERLSYTQQVVKESLRLYPPTWTLFVREVIAPVELGGYDLPRGSWVYLLPWVTQRDARFFPDPLRYDPERFAPANADKLIPYSYFPFGAGPHVCIGNTFAMMELTLIVATIARRWRLRLVGDRKQIQPEPLLSVRPAGGLHVQLERR